jgi:hypothetical protein
MIMKEKAWKKVILFAAVCVMALSMLAACSKPPVADPEPLAPQESSGVVFNTSSEVTVDLSGGGSEEAVTSEEASAAPPAEATAE